MTATIERMLPKRNYNCREKGKMAEIANSNEINISNAIIQIGRASIGDPFIMTVRISSRQSYIESYQVYF